MLIILLEYKNEGKNNFELNAGVFPFKSILTHLCKTDLLHVIYATDSNRR